MSSVAVVTGGPHCTSYNSIGEQVNFTACKILRTEYFFDCMNIKKKFGFWMTASKSCLKEK